MTKEISNELLKRINATYTKWEQTTDDWCDAGWTKQVLKSLKAGDVLPNGLMVAPVEPDATLIDEGAQALAQWGENSTWPDSWENWQVIQFRKEARKVYITMLQACKEE